MGRVKVYAMAATAAASIVFWSWLVMYLVELIG